MRLAATVNFLAVLVFAASPIVAADASVKGADAARPAYLACAACHDPSQAQKNGPDLRGIMGRVSGSAPGFRYSRALKSARLVWDEATLDRFLTDPQAMVPGNVMAFPGQPDPAERASVIAHLKTLR